MCVSCHKALGFLNCFIALITVILLFMVPAARRCNIDPLCSRRMTVNSFLFLPLAGGGRLRRVIYLVTVKRSDIVVRNPLDFGSNLLNTAKKVYI